MDNTLVHGLYMIFSLVIIFSCLFLKVPQIMHVREKKSAEGLYTQAMLMEITGFTIVTLYNFTNQYSLLTYLEYPIILVQVYVLLYFVLKYKDQLDNPLVQLATLIYTGLVLGFATQILPKSFLSYLLPLCTPLNGVAKVTYIYGIISAQNSSAVALSTWLISISTNLARLFTVYVDSADTKLMFNFIVSAILSLGVLLTALAYRDPAEGAKSGAGPKLQMWSEQCEPPYEDEDELDHDRARLVHRVSRDRRRRRSYSRDRDD